MSDPFLTEFWAKARQPWNKLGPEIAAGMAGGPEVKPKPAKCTRWAKLLKEERLRRGLTQEAVARHFGAEHHYVFTAEANIASPTAAVWSELAAFYGITLE